MTRYRYPNGWNTRREPGQRPRLEGSWLDPVKTPSADASLSTRQSFAYWTKIHWATPPWTTPQMFEEMREIYESANPKWNQVDHIVPLSHPLVCGLNVPWNMSIETIQYNQSKSNNYWPDCPDHLCPEKNLPADMFGGPEPYQTRLAL